LRIMVFIGISLDSLDNYRGKGFNPAYGKELGILTGNIDKYQCVSLNLDMLSSRLANLIRPPLT